MLALTQNPSAMQAIKSPEWIINFFKSVDVLDTSKNSGFSYFADNVQMQFGQQLIKGITSVKRFFRKIDAPLKTSHHVVSVWRLDNIVFLQGRVSLRDKKMPLAQTQTFPFFNFFWLNQKRQVVYYVVVIPVALQKFLKIMSKRKCNSSNAVC